MYEGYFVESKKRDYILNLWVIPYFKLYIKKFDISFWLLLIHQFFPTLIVLYPPLSLATRGNEVFSEEFEDELQVFDD